MVNYNPLYSTNYKLEFLDAPSLNYFSQSVTLPGINANGVEIPYKGSISSFQSDRIDYDPLSIRFVVDENFENYLFLLTWMKEYTLKEPPSKFMKDATLFILTNNKTYHPLQFTFIGMFPISLGSITFDSSTMTTNPVICDATFKYQTFNISKV